MTASAALITGLMGRNGANPQDQRDLCLLHALVM
jgi:hypothetical protein